MLIILTNLYSFISVYKSLINVDSAYAKNTLKSISNKAQKYHNFIKGCENEDVEIETSVNKQVNNT